MIVIGLCGGSGSGKGKVAEIFASLGVPSIDADLVYRDLTVSNSPLVKKLSDRFGDSITDETGALDRAALSKIVFSDKKALEDLNKISHEHILAETERRISELSKIGYRYVIFDAPLLFESGFDKKCDVTICVVADRELRIRRIIIRDSISRQRAEARIAAQLSDEFLIGKCDYVIYNNDSEDSLHKEVASIANKIIER